MYVFFFPVAFIVVCIFVFFLLYSVLCLMYIVMSCMVISLQLWRWLAVHVLALYRGEYRVVYVTPEFIEADGCGLLKQLHSKVGLYYSRLHFVFDCLSICHCHRCCIVGNHCSVSFECPREKARLQRSAGGVLLSPWSWSSHLFLGRPGRRFQLRSGRRPSRRSTAEPDGMEYPRRAWLRDRRASYGVGWLTLTQDWGRSRWWPLCCVCGPASRLSGPGMSYKMLPDALCQQLTVSMSRRRMQGQV